MNKELFAKTQPQLKALFTAQGLPAFRAAQVMHWIYEKKVFEFDKMTNLGKSAIEVLKNNFSILPQDIGVCSELNSKDQKTCKVLLRFIDGQTCESVLMKQHYGNSVCVSSQIGCAMQCAFCASGLLGFVRNISAAEMLAQVMYFATKLPQAERISNVVIMGSGEPLLNYDNVLEFIKLLHNPQMFNISYRNITLSTSGIVPLIYKLQQEDLPINLAISLHGASDAVRDKLMPINKRYNLTELINAGKEYGRLTSRQVTYEYILLDGVNDSLDDAKMLSNLLKGQLSCVNLIPANGVDEHNLRKSNTKNTKIFYEYLQKSHIPVTIRKEMGADINAACGQLRNKVIIE